MLLIFTIFYFNLDFNRLFVDWIGRKYHLSCGRFAHIVKSANDHCCGIFLIVGVDAISTIIFYYMFLVHHLVLDVSIIFIIVFNLMVLSALLTLIVLFLMHFTIGDIEWAGKEWLRRQLIGWGKSSLLSLLVHCLN